ncbi:hypothetical protein HDV00_008544 [Rhizophlyctis rosea]|nr:hypothetical protein HDV00_008544 [Rhizophlyctis rosea]
MPVEARLALLRDPEPLEMNNLDDFPEDETASIFSSSTGFGRVDFKYSLTVVNRVVPSGGMLTCNLQLSELPDETAAYSSRVSRVVASVQCSKEYLTNMGSRIAAREMVNVTEMVRAKRWQGQSVTSGESGADGSDSWAKTFTLGLPITELTLESPLVIIKHTLRILIYGDSHNPLAVIEAPITVVPGDEVYMRGRPRNGSSSSSGGRGLRESHSTLTSSSSSTGMPSPYPHSFNSSPISPGGSPRPGMDVDGNSTGKSWAGANISHGESYGTGSGYSPGRRPSEAHSGIMETSSIRTGTSNSSTPPSANPYSGFSGTSPQGPGGLAGVDSPMLQASSMSIASQISTTPKPLHLGESVTADQSASHPLGSWAKATLSDRSAPFEPNDKRKLYRAGVNYDPQAVDEIGLRRGDLIVVMDVFKDGWAFGKNELTQQTGFVFLEYLVLVSNGDGTVTNTVYEVGERPPPSRGRASSRPVHGSAPTAYAPPTVGSAPSVMAFASAGPELSHSHQSHSDLASPTSMNSHTSSQYQDDAAWNPHSPAGSSVRSPIPLPAATAALRAMPATPRSSSLSRHYPDGRGMMETIAEQVGHGTPTEQRMALPPPPSIPGVTTYVCVCPYVGEGISLELGDVVMVL